MTLQYYKDLPAIIEAVENGDHWEWLSVTGRWIEPQESTLVQLIERIENNYEVRLKPAPPAPRWWEKDEDVPMPICWIRGDGIRGVLITGFPSSGHGVIANTGHVYSWKDIADRKLEYTTDGKQWKPCQTEGER